MAKKTIVIQLPEDSEENINSLAQDISRTLDLGQYSGAVVSVVTPDIADYIDQEIQS